MVGQAVDAGESEGMTQHGQSFFSWAAAGVRLRVMVHWLGLGCWKLDGGWPLST